VPRRRKFVSPERGALSSARRRGAACEAQSFVAIRSTTASRSSAVRVGHASITRARSGSAPPARPSSGVDAAESAGSAPHSAPPGMTFPGFPERIDCCSNRVAPTFRLFGDLREKHPANGRQRPASLADAFHQSVEYQSQHGIAVASVVVALAAA